MKNKLTTIDATTLPVIEWKGVRVVTTETLAAGYGATSQQITNNFNRNKNRFEEGKHYFRAEGDDVEILRNSLRGVQISSKARSCISGQNVVPPVMPRCWRQTKPGRSLRKWKMLISVRFKPFRLTLLQWDYQTF